jgi:hypothetical protein
VTDSNHRTPARRGLVRLRSCPRSTRRGQILARALISGAAQQAVTGLVDRKAQAVPDPVGSAPMTADEE